MEDKRFIEDSFLVKEISKISTMEKSIRQGHIPLILCYRTIIARIAHLLREGCDNDERQKIHRG